jgi:hypothetical protein
MFNEFWKQRGHLIEFVSLLCGVGALFIAIEPPESSPAATALLNIKLFWLLTITVSIVILFVNLWLYLYYLEREIKESRGLDLVETVSVALALGVAWLLLNLWIYILNLYSDSLREVTKWTVPGSSALVAAGSAYILRRFKNISHFTRTLFYACSVTLFFFAFFIFINPGRPFYLDWLECFVIPFLLWVAILYFVPHVIRAVRLVLRIKIKGKDA